MIHLIIVHVCRHNPLRRVVVPFSLGSCVCRFLSSGIAGVPFMLGGAFFFFSRGHPTTVRSFPEAGLICWRGWILGPGLYVREEEHCLFAGLSSPSRGRTSLRFRSLT